MSSGGEKMDENQRRMSVSRSQSDDKMKAIGGAENQKKNGCVGPETDRNHNNGDDRPGEGSDSAIVRWRRAHESNADLVCRSLIIIFKSFWFVRRFPKNNLK